MDATSGASDEPALEDFKKVFINPEIIETKGGEWVMNEGCLSLPEIREDVKRPDIVRMKYLDENFDLHEEAFSGFAGRIIQHEYDHLEGVLFIDHIAPLRKRLLKSKLRAIATGKITPPYRIKVPAG